MDISIQYSNVWMAFVWSQDWLFTLALGKRRRRRSQNRAAGVRIPGSTPFLAFRLSHSRAAI